MTYHRESAIQLSAVVLPERNSSCDDHAVRLVIAAAVSCIFAAGCSSGEDKQESSESPSSGSTPPPSASSAATSVDPCDLLTQTELEELAGDPVGDPKPGLTGGLANCQWDTSGGRFLQVVGASSSDWAHSLPEILRTLEDADLLTDPENRRKLREGAELIEAGQELNPGQACAMFTEMVELQGQPAGTTSIVTLVPNRRDPQAVTGQMCSGGRFTSVMIAAQGGLEGPPPTERVGKALKIAHRRTI